MIGKAINQYKILEKLGEGGMGVVYKAEDTKLHRKVALKFLPTNLTQNDEAKQRFMIEARAASALDHANVCTLHEINNTEDGQMYISMAHYDGVTLKDKLKAGALSITEAVGVSIQIAKGLARAHEAGIVHRDVKPANIIVTARDEVKIIDFGLAKLNQLVDLTKSGTTLGTVAYMSPEQALGMTVDHRADVWSLGVVLYEMLTGKQPFTGKYDHAIIYSLINDTHPPVSEAAKNIPEQFETIIDHALAKKPEDRYETMEEMLADLLIVSKAAQEFDTGIKSTGLKKRKRSKFKPVLITIIAAVLFMFGLGFWLYETDDPVLIAVLPLKDFGKEASTEWFRDSMTDALNTNLTKIGGLRVISQNSTMQYKDSPKTLPEIAKELGIKFVIDASVVKVENQVRLSARLVNALTNENLWAENYQRSFKNILKIQAEFARAIAREVSVQLTPREKHLFEQTKEIDPEAYTAYLRGRYLADISNSGSSDFVKALEQFKKAINLESGYAAAYAGLAYAYVSQGANGDITPQEGFRKAKEFATKALSLDPYSSEAYTSLGYADLLFSTNWQNMEKNLSKAIELNPSNTRALQWYAFYLNAQARHDEAIATMTKARRLDPLSPMLNNLTGLLHYFARDYHRAIVFYNQSIETHPNALLSYNFLSVAQMELGMYDKAMKSLHKLFEFNPKNPSIFYTGWLGRIHALNGNREKALQIIKEIQGEHHKISITYAALGENDKAFEHIEKWLASQNHVVLLKVAPWWDPIRSDPRFKELLKRVGLDD